LLESKDANVRAAAAETFSYAIFDEPAIAALGKKLVDPSPKVRRSTLRALAVNANWRSENAQQALADFVLNPGKAVDEADRVGALDAIVYASRLQVKGMRQDAVLFKPLVALLEDKNEELRTMAANTLAPIRDAEFRGDLGRPERKTPEGGWIKWVDEMTAKAEGYKHDYQVCAGADSTPGVEAFCTGGGYLLGRNLKTGQPMQKDPALAFKNTLQAAEQGYVPAENALGLMYANGKGTQQNYAEAAKWWTKAAEAGHLQAAFHTSMVYRGGPGVPANAALSAKWAKFVEEKTTAANR